MMSRVSQRENEEPKTVQMFNTADIITPGEICLTHTHMRACLWLFISSLCLDDDSFIRKQKYLKAQAFALKMRPHKEMLQVNFVSTDILSQKFCVCKSACEFFFSGTQHKIF